MDGSSSSRLMVRSSLSLQFPFRARLKYSERLVRRHECAWNVFAPPTVIFMMVSSRLVDWLGWKREENDSGLWSLTYLRSSDGGTRILGFFLMVPDMVYD